MEVMEAAIVSEFDLRLSGGTAVLPGIGPTAVDIGVRGGRIAALLAPGAPGRAEETVDVTARVILPGAIDAHVHLGQDITVPKTAEDVAAETASAAAGGVTSLLAYLMSPEPYERSYAPAVELMGAHAHTDFGFHFCVVTRAQLEAIPRYVREFGVSSFKFFMNFRGEEGAYLGLPGNDDGFLHDLLQIAAANGAMVDPHAENIELIWRLREQVPRGAHSSLADWNQTRPPYVEAEAEQRVAYLAGVAGASVYAVHVTSAAALHALSTQRRDYPDIFIETCPHYLTLDVDSDLGSRGKVNPPLRTAADREALWAAVADGRVDVIGSDHVPRHFSAKDKDMWSASAGFPGTGTLLPLLISEGHIRRGLPWSRIAELTSTRPAQLFGLYPRKGVIAPGSDADLAVIDLSEGYRIDAANDPSRSGYSVWQDWQVNCRVEHTLLRGQFAVRSGQVKTARGRYLHRSASGAAALAAQAAAAADPAGTSGERPALSTEVQAAT
jgi:dihydropyrimidinase